MNKYIQSICYREIELELFKQFDVKQRIEFIAINLNIEVYYNFPFSSELIFMRGGYHLFLNNELSDIDLWQTFGRLISMYLNDNKQIVSCEETVEDSTGYEICIPMYLLQYLAQQNASKAQLIEYMVDAFNVQRDFAEKRLELYYLACTS